MQETQRLSGKKLTIATVAGLVLVGGGLAYILWVYSDLDVARNQSNLAWRALATELDGRYRTLEPWMGQAATAEQADKFRAACDDFRTSSLRRVQQVAAEELEQLLLTTSNGESPSGSAHQAEAPPPTPSAGLDEALQTFNRAQEQERSIMQSTGGKLLDLVLGIPPAANFTLARPLAESSPAP